MKEVTAEEVFKTMRNDSKKLDEAMDELERLRADLRKAGEMITQAAIRYKKEKLKKRSLKAAATEDEFAELEDYNSREEIRNCYGYDMITEAEMERLMYLWDLREEQKQKKNREGYEDGVTKMLDLAANAIEDKYRERKAMQTARERAQAINESRHGFLFM